MTKMIKGAVMYGERTADTIEYPVPVPGPGEVLIQMKTSAICGSDLHRYRMDKSFREFAAPFVPGHEPSGIVVELGAGCNRAKVGDRVSVFHLIGCGHCRHCRVGMPQWCSERVAIGHPEAFGGDADYMTIVERNALKLPDGLTFDDGAMIACIAATGFSSMRKIAPSGEDTVVIFGQGPVGLSGLIMAKAMGARVIGVEVMEERRALSRALGADETIDPTAVDVISAVKDLTKGYGADATFETSGNAQAQADVINVLRPAGRGVQVGHGHRGPTINPSSLCGKELTLMGSVVMPMHYFWDLADFMLEHDLSAKYQQMITHRYPITEAAEAFRMADSRTAGKVVFNWD